MGSACRVINHLKKISPTFLFKALFILSFFHKGGPGEYLFSLTYKSQRAEAVMFRGLVTQYECLPRNPPQ